MAKNGEIDTKHFLMAIIAIVAIVAISFIAVLLTNNVGAATQPIIIQGDGLTGQAYSGSVSSVSPGDLDCFYACMERADPTSCKKACQSINYDFYFDNYDFNN